MQDERIYLTGASYLASTPGIELETKFQGLLKRVLSGESLFLIRCSGSGDLWFNSYGAIFPLNVEDEYIVDTGHIVAFTDGLDYNIEILNGYKSFFSRVRAWCAVFGERAPSGYKLSSPLHLSAGLISTEE